MTLQNNEELGLLADNLRYYLGAEARGEEYNFGEREKAMKLIEAYSHKKLLEGKIEELKMLYDEVMAGDPDDWNYDVEDMLRGLHTRPYRRTSTKGE